MDILNHTILSVTTIAENLPKDPLVDTPPLITPVQNRSGRFIMDLSPASPKRKQGIDYNNIDPVAFLLRIKLMNLQTFSFIWAVSCKVAKLHIILPYGFCLNSTISYYEHIIGRAIYGIGSC